MFYRFKTNQPLIILNSAAPILAEVHSIFFFKKNSRSIWKQNLEIVHLFTLTDFLILVLLCFQTTGLPFSAQNRAILNTCPAPH